eukprot:6132215-Lingulodinium_polyedra.AAC.1
MRSRRSRLTRTTPTSPPLVDQYGFAREFGERGEADGLPHIDARPGPPAPSSNATSPQSPSLGCRVG